MTLKELKEIIKGKHIDRVAGFCNSYEQMFDRCCIDESRSDSVVIDTFEFEDEHDPRFIPVSEAMAKLLEMSAKHDDDRVIMTGLDNNVSNEVLFRNVSCAKLIPSAEGNAGLCLLGREPLRFIDDVDDDEFLDYERVYHVKFIIEDPRAQNLNEKFMDFISANCNWPPSCERSSDDAMYFTYYDDATFLSFVTDEGTSANLIALIAGAFDGAYFTRTPLTRDSEVERLSNDRHGKCFGPCQAVVYPAYRPDDYNVPHLREIASSICYAKECASKDEMEQFIASLNPDEAVGDLVRRITTRYIDPLTLILE